MSLCPRPTCFSFSFHLRQLLLFSLIAFACNFSAMAQVQILLFKSLVDGNGERLTGREIAVEGKEIRAVGDRLQERFPAAGFLDLSRLTAIPGLIDVHTHITYGLLKPAAGNAWRESGRLTHGEKLLAAARNALRTLETGVTTIRDLNAGNALDFQLRELIDGGVLTGPRIFLAGRGIHPGSFPDRPTSQPRNLVAEATAAAASRVADGVDWVKIYGTSGSASDLSSRLSLPEEALAGAITTAKRLGARVAVHSYGPEAVAVSIRSGADSIEHATGVPDSLLSEMAEKGVVYVPTVDHNRYYAAHASEYGYDSATQKALLEFVERNRETLSRALRAGVTVAMGSDAVFSGFGENTWELRQFVKAGMTPAEALQTAAINAARLLGQESHLGRLASGFSADIVALNGDPLSDIESIISGVEWVMKDGQVVVDKR